MLGSFRGRDRCAVLMLAAVIDGAASCVILVIDRQNGL
jgi:hypothetical protein